MKSEVKVGRGCGWIRVSLSPGKQGTLVYLNVSTQVSDVARDLLLSPEYTIWLQYGGGEPRPLGRTEKPLQIQEEFLTALGYKESSRRARLGIDPDLSHLIAFLTGEDPQREEREKVCGAEEGSWPRGGRHVIKVLTPSRSVYLGMEELWQRGLWSVWLAQEENRPEGDLSGLGLTEVTDELRQIRPRLDLSRNQLTGHLPELSALRLSVAENRLTSVTLPREAVSLDFTGNKIPELPEGISRLPRLEELRLDRNLVDSLPPGPYRDLRILSAAQNRISELPHFLGSQQLHRHLYDIEEDFDEKPEKLENVNLRGNSLKGTIILGNYGNLTQLDVSENSIEALDLTALERLQNVHCSKNKLQELSINGTALVSLIAGNNCLTKLTVHPRPTKLRHLDISYNQLESLPEWVSDCPSLRTLFASHNSLTRLPDRLFSGDSSSLGTLQLSFNQLTTLPQPSKSLCLQQIFLQGNRIRTLPHQFFMATLRLRTLNLTKNRLEELPSTIPQGHQLERLYLTCNQLTQVDCLAAFSNLRLLHLSYNLVSQLPNQCVPSWPEMEELLVSGNRLDRLPPGLSDWRHLRVLRLHCNLIQQPPALAASSALKVLDLSHNNLEKVNLTTMIPKQLQFLDISGNSRLQVDAKQFYDIKAERAMSLVDTSGKGRASLPTSPQENHSSSTVWELGFSETPGTRERLCISQLRLTGFCGNEALVGLFDSGTDPELPKLLASSVPRILLEERTVKETANEYMKYTLLAAHRELKERGQRAGSCALVCHMCQERGSGLRKRTLRVATVGEAKAVLARASSSLTLAHLPTQIIRSQVGNSSLYPLVVPDPHVTELSLRDDDRFLILANKRLWEVVSAEEAAAEVRTVSVPGLAAKRLQDLAQSYGCEDNLSVIVVSLQQASSPSSSPTYRLQSNRQSLRLMFGTLTGLQRHLRLLGIKADGTCPKYGQEQETAIHLVAECEAFAALRFRTLGSDILSTNELKTVEWQKVLDFVRQTITMRNQTVAGAMLIDLHQVDKATRRVVEKQAQGKIFYTLSPKKSGGAGLSDEQFRCWEYMLEQNTQLLFDKELGSISKGAGISPHQRKFLGSSRSSESCCQKTSAYFGSISRAPVQYINCRERSETDSLETEDRMSKYWDVATTEL